MNAPLEKIRALLIEDDPDDAHLVLEMLSDSTDVRFDVQWVERMSEAKKALAGSTYDVLLLDWILPDTSASEGMADNLGSLTQMPVVVLTRLKDEDLARKTLQAGVQDFLIKGRFDEKMLVRSLKFAVARHQALNCELDALECFNRPPAAQTTAQMFGQRSLRESAPGAFDQLVDQYARILEETLEQRAFKVDLDISEQVREVAEGLGWYTATPRDVVELHSQGLKKLSGKSKVPKIEAAIQEGRWVLLQLMGYLASYYRGYYMATTRGRPRREDETDG